MVSKDDRCCPYCFNQTVMGWEDEYWRCQTCRADGHQDDEKSPYFPTDFECFVRNMFGITPNDAQKTVMEQMEIMLQKEILSAGTSVVYTKNNEELPQLEELPGKLCERKLPVTCKCEHV